MKPRVSLTSGGPIRVGELRHGSPHGGSTLITFAPRSESITPLTGPAMISENSTTVIPSSGPAICHLLSSPQEHFLENPARLSGSIPGEARHSQVFPSVQGGWRSVRRWATRSGLNRRRGIFGSRRPSSRPQPTPRACARPCREISGRPRAVSPTTLKVGRSRGPCRRPGAAAQ